MTDYSSDTPAWTWGDYGQSKRIQALREDVSAMTSSLAQARSSTRRLQSELSKVTGSLEQRLNRLSVAFDAFVELSDLRMTLALFDEHARVRHRARQLFGENPLPGELSDVDGYWLAPALAGLQSTVDGAQAGAALDLARQRDMHRAPLFHTLALVLLGRQDLVGTAMLTDLLPEIDHETPVYQRALWTLAADGFLGAAGSDALLKIGSASLGTLPDEAREAAVETWLGVAKPDAPVKVDVEGAAELKAALDACARLSALRNWVTERSVGEPATEVDPIVKRTLELLVDEGSAVELPLLRRERELRRVIEDTDAPSGPQDWTAADGPMITLLRQDTGDAEHPARRAMAVRICAPHILAAADRLAELARRPVPEETKVRVPGGELTFTGAQLDVDSFDHTVRRVVGTPDNPHRFRPAVYALAAIGVAGLVLSVAAVWQWLFLVVAVLGIAGSLLWRERDERTKAAEKQASAKARLRSAAERCTAELEAARVTLARGRAGIEDDLSALRAALP
jgi:hypothetical protein